MMKLPSRAGLCRTTSYRESTPFMPSPLRLWKASRWVIAANRLSSPNWANHCCKPPTMYGTGSYCTPLIAPPSASSCGAIPRTISRAAPPSRTTTAATGWLVWLQVCEHNPEQEVMTPSSETVGGLVLKRPSRWYAIMKTTAPLASSIQAG